MNWEAVSAIAESLGVVVVVVSLIYLATQIKYAKLAAADLSRHMRANGVHENCLAMATNQDLRKSWTESAGLVQAYGHLAKRLGVDCDAAIQVDWTCTGWIWLHWGQWSSTTTKADLDELEQLIGVFYSLPPMATCWEYSPYERGLVDPGFARFVDGAVAKHGRFDIQKNAT